MILIIDVPKLKKKKKKEKYKKGGSDGKIKGGK